MFKRIRNSVAWATLSRRVISTVSTISSRHSTAVNLDKPTSLLNGNEFDADPITSHNWDGGIICRCVRRSKKHIWAFRMWLPEGFTITTNGEKIRGNPGNWLIIDGTQKYIVTERMFRKKYRKE